MIALLTSLAAVIMRVAHGNMPAHYLVGLLNYPNSFVPDALKDHTSGTAKASGQTCFENNFADGAFCDMEKGPFDFVRTTCFKVWLRKSGGVVSGAIRWLQRH